MGSFCEAGFLASLNIIPSITKFWTKNSIQFLNSQLTETYISTINTFGGSNVGDSLDCTFKSTTFDVLQFYIFGKKSNATDIKFNT